jgi:hypothetical protein
MYMSFYVVCPYLKGSRDGVMCGIANDLIKNMEGCTIKLCLSKHYEACSIYFGTLQRNVEEKLIIAT